MLKLLAIRSAAAFCFQPPSGGCVLKLPLPPLPWQSVSQPPSGGCVLKPDLAIE